MSPITTHILDTSQGKPAADVPVTLEYLDQTSKSGFTKIGSGKTDADGRIKDLLPPDHSMKAGSYRLSFSVSEYLTAHKMEIFYPEIQITFIVKNVNEHYHVPLLLGGFGYSTYRGS